MRRISETVLHLAYNGTGEDDYGDDNESWAAPAPLGIFAFNPGTTAEPFTAGHDERVETKPCMYVPQGIVIKARDLIIARGEPFEVDGDALDYRSPYGTTFNNGQQIMLKAVKG